jgi:hypothetical protein
MYFIPKRTHLTITTLVITYLFISLFNNQAISAEQRAIQKFKFALNACDRGMDMKMPRSKGSLRVLKSLLRRYQYNRDAALALDASVKDLDTEYYVDQFFTEQTSFTEAYQICENEFVEKVANAEVYIKQKMAERKARQKELEAKRQALIKKQQAAKREVFLAINEYCASFLRDPTSDVKSLLNNYQTAKQKALEFYPQIVNQVYQATVMDRENSKEISISKTIQAWFEYCETAFQPQQTHAEPPPVGPMPMMSMSQESMALIEKEGPRPPSMISETTTIENPENPKADEPNAKTDNLETDTPEEKTTLSMTDSMTEMDEIAKTFPETDTPKTEETTSSMAEIDKTAETLALLETKKQNEQLLKQPEENENVWAETEDEMAETDEEKDEEDENRNEEYTDADYQQELKEEFQKVMATLSGDRLTILKKEGRLPDYVDHDDGIYHKAKIWQYEEEKSNQCRIYTFKGNKLSQNKTEMGECPPFW